MATITLPGFTFDCVMGMGAFEGIGTAFSNVKKSTSSLSGTLGTLKSKINLASVVAAVDTSQDQTKKAEEREMAKKSSLSLAYEKLNDLISDVGSVDIKASGKIRERKEAFYDRYYYLKPECEKNRREKVKDAVCNGIKAIGDWAASIGEAIADFFISAVEWLKENWQSLVALVVTIVIAVVIVVASVLTFGAAAVAAAAIVGALVGLAGQFIGDVISWSITGEWSGTLQGYLGAAFGGMIGGILLLSCNPVAACAVDSGISTFFSQNLENVTGGEKRTMSEIFANTLFSAGTAAVLSKAFSGLSKTLSTKLASKFPFLSRLSGRGSYEASFNMVITKLKNKTITNFTWKTIRNGVLSGLAGGFLENITKGFMDGFKIQDKLKEKMNELPSIMPVVPLLPSSPILVPVI